MFRPYSRTVIANGDLEICRMFGKCNFNRTVLWSKSQCIIDQIAHRPLKQGGIGGNLCLPAASNRDTAIFRDRFIKRSDFFYCPTRVKSLPLDRFARGVDSRNEKQVVHDA